MAILKSESPAVTISEVDASGIVPSITSSTGAFVGDFAWGPIDTPVLVGNEAELISNFGSPAYLDEDSSSVEFLAANQFLKYSTSMYVVRGATASALNAADSSDIDASNGEAIQITNRDDFDASRSTITATFLAKYAGSVGNSIEVSVCAANATAFDAWEYESEFDAKPGTSDFATDAGTTLDEVHVIIADAGGDFTGKKDRVLEKWENVSLITDAKDENGRSNYILDVLNDRSEYVYGVQHPTYFGAAKKGAEFVANTHGGGSSAANAARTCRLGHDGVGVAVSGAAGANSGGLGTTEYASGFDQFEDENTIQVDFLIAPSVAVSATQGTIVTDLVTIAEGRKDCVVVASPARNDVIGLNSNTTIRDNIVATAASMGKSSYLVVDNNFLKVYDKYNDRYVFIPASSSTAGLMAATDNVAAPWFSPAGSRRGRYLGATALAFNPTKSDRDVLYKADVNPICNLPGQGITLYGDKTALGKASAFSRINVRRLFIAMERAIKGAAQNVLFEFNDEFTRAEFVGIVEPFLRDIQGRRGITDFRVVCDETNNTPDVVDSNSFVASVFVKPARSINYVQLNFVAVRTGVDFAEIIGTV